MQGDSPTCLQTKISFQTRFMAPTEKNNCQKISKSQNFLLFYEKKLGNRKKTFARCNLKTFAINHLPWLEPDKCMIFSQYFLLRQHSDPFFTKRNTRLQEAMVVESMLNFISKPLAWTWSKLAKSWSLKKIDNQFWTYLKK